MKKVTTILIAKDGWPVEEIEGRPIINLLRRLIHGSHRECLECWRRKQVKVNIVSGVK